MASRAFPQFRRFSCASREAKNDVFMAAYRSSVDDRDDSLERFVAKAFVTIPTALSDTIVSCLYCLISCLIRVLLREISATGNVPEEMFLPQTFLEQLKLRRPSSRYFSSTEI